MADIHIQWGSETAEQITVHSFEELEQILDLVQHTTSSTCPTLATIEGLHDYSIYLGLGSDVSILVFQVSQPDDNGWRQEYISRGERGSTTLYSFWLHNAHHTEFPGEYILPTSRVRQLLQEYDQQKTLPTTIEWDVNTF